MTIKDKGILSGIDISKKDNERICIYGMHNNSEDRKLKEEETYRTIFRRDRDRILYSGGFRRLQDKTQVMAAVKNGDHRTRLTHTLEVEQIAVSIADALKLNKDLTSAIALGHDIGHTPFGHAVESFLNLKLKDKGGFSHAVQSVRYLEEKKKKLSNEIIEGIFKHDTDSFTFKLLEENEDCIQIKNKKEYYLGMPPGTLEAQIVYWADKIAYLTHDFEDFYKSGLLEKAIKEENDKLGGKLDQIFQDLVKDIEQKSIFNEKGYISDNRIGDIIRNLIRNIIQYLVIESNEKIKVYLINNFDENDLKNNFDKQKFIREETNKLISKIYKTDYEYKLLEKIKVKKLNDLIKKEDFKDIEELKQYYLEILKNKESETSKKIKEIKKTMNKIATVIEDSKRIISLRNELEGKQDWVLAIDNIEKLKEYKELWNKDVNVFENRKNKIKKEAYQNGLIINLPENIMKHYESLRSILNEYYIGSQMIQLSDAKAKRIVESLYDMYLNNINILPIEFKNRINEKESNKTRVIADYISSMSDRYAEEVYMDLDSTGSHYIY